MKAIAGGWGWAAVLLAAAAGCESLQPRSVQIDAASGRYQSAQLTYQLDTGVLSQPVQTARIAAQQVSYQQQASSPLPERSHARLSVQYPHPRGKGGYALAEVVVEADQTPVKGSSGTDKSAFQRFADSVSGFMNDVLPGMQYGSGVREAWALDVPKEELDQLIGQLANSGYFSYGPDTTPGVEVFTRLDGKVIRKTWHQVPALNDFIERVRHEGQLVSYVRPEGLDAQPADAAGGRNDSVAAYHQQQQRQLQQQAGPPPQPFPTNAELAAQQAAQMGPQYPAPGAASQPQAYMAQRPADPAAMPGAATPQYNYASPPQYNNALAPPFNGANPPMYNNSAPPIYNNAAPNYAPPATPQMGNPPAAQYAPPATQYAPPAGQYAPPAAQYAPPAGSVPPGGGRETYPQPQPAPAYPQAAYPQTNQSLPTAQNYPATNAGYGRGY